MSDEQFDELRSITTELKERLVLEALKVDLALEPLFPTASTIRNAESSLEEHHVQRRRDKYLCEDRSALFGDEIVPPAAWVPRSAFLTVTQFNYQTENTAINKGSQGTSPGRQVEGNVPSTGARTWLRENCEVYLAIAASQPGNSETSSMLDAMSLYDLLLAVIMSEASVDELQVQLLDLIGYGEFALKFIEEVIRRRKEIVLETDGGNTEPQSKPNLTMAAGSTPGSRTFANRSTAFPPAPSDNARSLADLDVTTRTAPRSAGSQMKITRIGTGDSRMTGSILHRPGNKLVTASFRQTYQEHSFLTGPLSTLSAPEKEKGFDKVQYAEVLIPAAKKRTNGAAENLSLVPITSIHKVFQIAFSGVEYLNRMQSIVFEEAYHTDHNLLVCSPTGSGKTNVAMLTILREIRNQMDTNMKRINFENVKIIYVAPMKALAAEVVAKFRKRLLPLRVAVRELTGDMQLTRREIRETQIIVTTPEKWDVITRKGDNDDTNASLTNKVNLVVIDEIHLLGEDRGYVLECVIARLLRRLVRKQHRIRIVGLSATLPNYKEVGELIRADPEEGVFFFGPEFRPVPLTQKFIGLSTNIKLPKNTSDEGKNHASGTEAKKKRKAKVPKLDANKIFKILMNEVCWKEVHARVQEKKQVMVFVHSRKDTSGTVREFHHLNKLAKTAGLFCSTDDFLSNESRNSLSSAVRRSPNADVRNFFEIGFGIHHAGMLRQDRTLVERLFAEKAISVLICTATLAWGVNLPAQTVVVKGTEVYAPGKAGAVRGFSQISMQDVLQCFGRAGRPQYDTHGTAILITDQQNMNHYVRKLTNQVPLESSLIKHLPDCLNAEIASGSVTDLNEGIDWLSYTFLYVRMRRSPTAYGISLKEYESDPSLEIPRMRVLVQAGSQLTDAKMVKFSLSVRDFQRFSTRSLEQRLLQEGLIREMPFGVTDLGRVGSHFYLGYETIEKLNLGMKSTMDASAALQLVLGAEEFTSIRVREDEIQELSRLKRRCLYTVVEPIDSSPGKCHVLAQAYILGAKVSSFTLISDMNYISKNISRVISGVFEIALKKRWASLSKHLLGWNISFQRKCIPFPQAHVLSQFCPSHVKLDTLAKLVRDQTYWYMEDLCSLSVEGVRSVLGTLSNTAEAKRVHDTLRHIPYLKLAGVLKPITHDVVQVEVALKPSFRWNDQLHGTLQFFHVFVEDENQEWLYQYDTLQVRKFAEKHEVRKEDRSSLALASETRQPSVKTATKKPGKQPTKITKLSSHRSIHEKPVSKGADDSARSQAQQLRQTKPRTLANVLGASSDDSLIRRFYVPFFQPMPECYNVTATNPSYFGSESILMLSTKDLVLPKPYRLNTKLLNIPSVPIASVDNVWLGKAFKTGRYFNPYIAQLLHDLLHGQKDVLVAGPEEMEKLDVVKIATANVLQQQQQQLNGCSRIIYLVSTIATANHVRTVLKEAFNRAAALKLCSFAEYGDDASSRNIVQMFVGTFKEWATFHARCADYVEKASTKVKLFLVDDLHLIGERAVQGGIIEAVVSDITLWRQSLGAKFRLIGLSNELANPMDMSHFLSRFRKQKDSVAVFNFKSRSLTELHIQSFPERQYSARMSTMSKPVLSVLRKLGTGEKSIIFVGSKQQTTQTALDLVSMLATTNEPLLFLNLEKMAALQTGSIDHYSAQVRDSALSQVISFGIGVLHRSLSRYDREVCEHLYQTGVINVLVCQSDLVWELPAAIVANVVLVKGTESYDSQTHELRPSTVPLLEKMFSRIVASARRAGSGHVYCQDVQKSFVKKFLTEPFPVESTLLSYVDNGFMRTGGLCQLLNQWIAKTNVTTESAALESLKATYFYQRLRSNPCYYGVHIHEQAMRKVMETSPSNDVAESHGRPLGDKINSFLKSLLQHLLSVLRQLNCITLPGAGGAAFLSTSVGQAIAKTSLKLSTLPLLVRGVENLSGRYGFVKQTTALPEVKQLDADVFEQFSIDVLKLLVQCGELHDLDLVLPSSAAVKRVDDAGTIPGGKVLQSTEANPLSTRLLFCLLVMFVWPKETYRLNKATVDGLLPVVQDLLQVMKQVTAFRKLPFLSLLLVKLQQVVVRKKRVDEAILGFKSISKNERQVLSVKQAESGECRITILPPPLLRKQPLSGYLQRPYRASADLVIVNTASSGLLHQEQVVFALDRSVDRAQLWLPQRTWESMKAALPSIVLVVLFPTVLGCDQQIVLDGLLT